MENEVEINSPSRMGPVVGIFLILISVVGYFFFSGPMSSDQSEMQANIAEKESKVDELKAQIDAFDSAEVELGISTEVQRLELLNSIPIEMKQDEVIRDLIDIADVHDITLRSLSFGEGGSSYEGVDALRINASFEGGYSDLVSFLEGLEQNARIFKVDSINVQLDELAILNLQRATFSLSMEAFFATNL